MAEEGEKDPLEHDEPPPADNETAPPSQTASTLIEPLQDLHTPHRRRRLKLVIGVLLATLDLCCLPITYFYAFKYGTGLKLQDIFAIITAVYGMLSFTHYAFRSLKLFRSKTSSLWRPIGWTQWGMLEFLQINVLIIITLVEVELVAGTAPHNPIIRLCAMPSPTICFYIGFLFCSSAILTQLGWKLPFNMSSTPKRTPWRPALFGFIEDAGAIEGQGGVEFRAQLIKRYEMSPRFRRMILLLTWGWGLALLSVATLATVLVMVIEANIGFGLGWGLPYAFGALYVFITIGFVKSQLAKERAEWGSKNEGNGAVV